MINFEYISHSENDTMNFAEKLASKMKMGDIIVLNGDLGAGKTKFTEGFLRFFGLSNEVSSPTFTIINEYHADNINIFHFDVYRLSSSDEFYSIGGDDYFSAGICIIEWGNIIKDALPKDYIEISFSKSDINENDRILNVHTYGTKNDCLFNN
jgi:tRNA threonylcarbamoyladenosine biosynthesis protein TsaE